MRLRKLQICGFKSFPDQTAFHFHDGITGIVGPNGCGKSNIVDAIRWAMGEQSAKTLRGGAMEDLIFNGSESRQPVNMAEVLLTFSNEGGYFPAPYAERSEITVGRRLHRTGESEYIINNTPCRLKDITDLFLGSGVGARAYSIIEQGQISQVVNAKPEDRRYLIEELAGISKYRGRKAEAQRKLDGIQENLERVRDIMAEVKRQMNSLNRQAKAAERYKLYHEELRAIEVRLLMQKHEELNRLKLENRKNLEQLQQERLGAISEISGLETEIETATERKAETERELNTWQNEDFQRRQTINEVRNRQELNRQARKSIEDQASGFATERENLTSQVTRLEERIAESAAERERLGASVAELDRAVEERQAQVNARDEEYRAAHQNREDARTRAVETEKEQHRLAARLEEIAREVAAARESLAEVEAQGSSITHEERELAEKRSAGTERRGAIENDRQTEEERIAALDEALQQTEEALEERRNELQDIVEEQAHTRSRAESLESLLSGYEGFQEAVRLLMGRKEGEEAQTGIRGIVADVLRTDPGMEQALEAALGERIQTLLADNRETALAACARLGETEAGRARFVDLSSLDAQPSHVGPTPPPEAMRLAERCRAEAGYEPLVPLLLDNIWITEEARHAVELSASHGVTVVTPAGFVAERGRWISCGRAGGEVSVFERRRLLEESRDRLVTLQESRESLDEQVLALRAEAEAKEEELVQARRGLHRIDIQLAELQKDEQRWQAEAERLAQQRRRDEERLQALQTRIAEREREAEERTAALREKKQELDELRGEVERVGAAADIAWEAKEAALRTLTEARIGLSEGRERLRGMESQEQELRNMLEQHRTTLEQRSRDLEQGGKQLESLEDARSSLEAELETKLEEHRVFLSSFEEIKERFQVVSRELEERQTKLREATQRRDKAAEALHQVEMTSQRCDLDLEHLAETAREKFQFELGSDAAPPAHEAVEAMEPEQYAPRKEELEIKLGRIGMVNLAAIDEFKEQEERYTFLQTQHDDLIESIESMEKAIAKINRTYNERFREAFTQLADTFENLFPTLFKGGKAQLLLTDEHDLQNTGLEIIVRMPGKKTQRVSLLSGGERALTAISLIFSLFLVKPSPFCLLDEVDAPLDDANVGRFNELVQRMRESSQFVLITHNKQTMESTDVLWGVTMEEKGVSKSVSVKLN